MNLSLYTIYLKRVMLALVDLLFGLHILNIPSYLSGIYR
jgi:hypothetical protein